MTPVFLAVDPSVDWTQPQTNVSTHLNVLYKYYHFLCVLSAGGWEVLVDSLLEKYTGQPTRPYSEDKQKVSQRNICSTFLLTPEHPERVLT